MIRLVLPVLTLLIGFGCTQGDSSRTLSLSVPADGEVTAVFTTTGTPQTADRADSFRADFSIFPDRYEPDIGGITVSMEGALRGAQTFLFGNAEPVSDIAVGNDLMSECAVGEACTIETRITFSAVGEATADIDLYGTMTIDEGEVEDIKVTVAEE